MSDDTLEKLAIAYAQTKLTKHQNENDCDLLESEIEYFLKAYYFALHELPIINDSLDECF